MGNNTVVGLTEVCVSHHVAVNSGSDGGRGEVVAESND